MTPPTDAAAAAPSPLAGSPSLPEVHRSVAVPNAGGFLRKLFAFMGPGYLVAVGYMDPGNWATALAGGSAFGYTLLCGRADLLADGDPAAGALRPDRRRHRPRPRAALPRALPEAGRLSALAFCRGGDLRDRPGGVDRHRHRAGTAVRHPADLSA